MNGKENKQRKKTQMIRNTFVFFTRDVDNKGFYDDNKGMILVKN